uniref:Uncharacterized protein n=1 Tax=Rhizophora mucronata TaxID=61149 RepID=A0A2P2NBS2_RHIMU
MISVWSPTNRMDKIMVLCMTQAISLYMHQIIKQK